MAEDLGVEPREDSHPLQFSKLLQSATLPILQKLSYPLGLLWRFWSRETRTEAAHATESAATNNCRSLLSLIALNCCFGQHGSISLDWPAFLVLPEALPGFNRALSLVKLKTVTVYMYSTSRDLYSKKASDRIPIRYAHVGNTSTGTRRYRLNSGIRTQHSSLPARVLPDFGLICGLRTQ